MAKGKDSVSVVEFLEKQIGRMPGLNGWYWGRSARLKKQYCLLLHRMGRLKPETFVQWLATYSCNYTCPFCEASAGRRAPDELTTGEALVLVDDLSALGVKRLLVSGGEPLERPDLMEIFQHALRKGLQLGLVTNGFHVAEKWEQLRRFRFFLYFTSLDGSPAYHIQTRGHPEAFELAMQALRLFATLNVPTRMVNSVVSPGNLSELEKLHPLLRAAGVTHWRLTPISNVGRAEGCVEYQLDGKGLNAVAEFIRRHQGETLPRIEWAESHCYLQCVTGAHSGKAHFCGAGLTRCSIMPNGDVLGCQQVYDSSLAEGNVRTKPFSRIWKEEFKRFRTRQHPAACEGCSFLGECQGGCWAEMEKQGHCLKDLWGKRESS
jgi:radical SAM protein with 4Fe4S-binding SPASM domain